MNTRKRVLLAVALAAVVGIGAVLWARFAGREDGQALVLYGNVDIREVELAFRVPGRLAKMRFEEGDAVTSGQVVAELDAEPYEEALAAADARVEQARANVAKLEAGSRPQEVERARSGVHEAEAAARNAASDFARQEELLASGASSEKVRDAARARRDSTAAQLAAAKEALALAEEGFRREDVAAARADLAAAVAQRELAQTQLDDTALAAPSVGTLIARVREPGSMVAAGMPVYSLSLRNPLYVRAYVDEPHLGRLAPGRAVTLHTDSSDKIYHGQIGFISPRAEFTPKSVETTSLRTDLVYRLRIVVSDADEGLRQGMPVTVRIDADASAGT
jgi:membrane fusion protein YbhG